MSIREVASSGRLLSRTKGMARPVAAIVEAVHDPETAGDVMNHYSV